MATEKNPFEQIEKEITNVIQLPEKKEERLTNSKKGKVILVNSIARINLLLSSINPGAIIYTR